MTMGGELTFAEQWVMDWLAVAPRRCVIRSATKEDRWRLALVGRILTSASVSFASVKSAGPLDLEGAIRSLVASERLVERTLDNGRRFYVHPKWGRG